jgi:hypothetical protein
MREVNSSEQEDKEGVDSGLCRGAKIREWMSCALSLSLSLFICADDSVQIQSERRAHVGIWFGLS